MDIFLKRSQLGTQSQSCLNSDRRNEEIRNDMRNIAKRGRHRGDHSQISRSYESLSLERYLHREKTIS